MASWYIHGTTGSDANSGLTELLPRLTLPANASVTAGDTINIAGTIRSSAGDAASFSYSKSNLIFQQWPGQTQAILHGGTLAGTGWVQGADVGGGTQWTKTLATGLTISRFAYKYDASTTSTGHHYGIMRTNALALTLGEATYNSGTGAAIINIPTGQSPNGSTADVLIAKTDAVLGAITFVGGSGQRVTGIHFKLYPSSAGQFGWGVCCNPATNVSVTSCSFWDMGNHCAGTLGAGACSGCIVSGCTFYSNRYNGSHVVFYQENASGNLTGCILSNSTVHIRRYLGVDGTNATESLAVTQGQSANVQTGFLAHSDSGTNITDVLGDGNTFIEYEPGSTAWSADNVPTPTSGWAWSDFGFRVDRCTLRGGGSQTGASRLVTANHIAMRRCIIDLRNAGASTLARASGVGAFPQSGASKITLLEACSVIAMLEDGANETVLFYPYGAAAEFRLLNTSVHIADASAGSVYRYICGLASRTDNFIRARGSVFSEASDWFGNVLVGQDSGSLLAQHDFTDNAYYLRTATYSNAAAWDTAAEWLASVDTAARTITTAPFLNAPTDLSLTSASSIWTLRRTTSTVVPVYGINGPYRNIYGAYQYSLSMSPGFVGAGGGSSRRVRNRGR